MVDSLLCQVRSSWRFWSRKDGRLKFQSVLVEQRGFWPITALQQLCTVQHMPHFSSERNNKLYICFESSSRWKSRSTSWQGLFGVSIILARVCFNREALCWAFEDQVQSEEKCESLLTETCWLLPCCYLSADRSFIFTVQTCDQFRSRHLSYR